MADHYITVDENNIVVNAFSSDFKEPRKEDICVLKDGERHFRLEIKEDFAPLYRYRWNPDKKEIEHDKGESQLETIRPWVYGGIVTERNKLLFESDWTQMPDSPLSEAKKDEWKIYRQTLRDITKLHREKSIKSMEHLIEWPEKPL